MAKTTVHVVKKGEALDKIARAYGLKSFRQIYDDPVNAKFRKQRPNPDAIQPGDKIVIPNFALTPDKRRNLKTLIATIEARIKKVEARRSAFQKMHDAAVRDVRKTQAEFKRTSSAIDAAALVLNLLKSLTKMSVKGMQMAGKEGDEIVKANKEIMKELGGMHLDAVSPALQKGAKKMSDSQSRSVAVMGAVGESYFNLTSPSFWAKTYIKANEQKLFHKIISGKFGEGWEAWSKAVTWDPVAEFDKTIKDMEQQANRMVKAMNDTIAEDRKLVASLKSVAAT